MKKSVKKTLTICTVAICLLSAIMFAGCSKEEATDQDTSKDLSKVTTFQKMKVQDLNEKDVDASIFKKNKLTIVNFWSTSCTHCIQELPALEKISKEMKSKGVGVKGFLFESGGQINSSILDIVKKENVTYQQLIGAGEIMDDDVIKNITAVPTTFAVDSSGNIVSQTTGAMDYDGWVDFINKALKKVK